MTLFSRVTEICRERLPSIRVARITIDSIFDLDKMLQPGIRFGVTVRNTIELVGTPIASMGNFYFSVDVMDGDERWIIQKMENWRNGTYQAFYRIFYDEECVTRLDGVDGEELGWRNAYDVFQLNAKIKRELEKRVDLYNLSVNVPPAEDFYTLSVMSTEAQYAPTHVPVGLRKNGLIITFRSHSEWESWQFVSSEMSDFEDAGYWVRKDVTKQLIESLLTGEIKSHRHPSSNYVLDSSSSEYGYYVMEQDAPMQASKSVPAGNRFIHLTISFQTLTAWESWQFIGTDITTQWNNVDYWLKIPVGPSLALGEVLGTAYDGSKGKANADAIASISSDLSTAVSKLEGIQEYAEVNQFAFSSIIVGSSVIDSTTKTDTFELVEGSNITLSSSGKKITISSSNVDTTYGPASDTALGLVKIGYTQNSKNYPLVLDANNKAYVNVPWELSDTSDLVTKSTAQTITGLKTFDSDVKLTAGKAIELDKVKFLYNPTGTKLDISNSESGQPLNIVTTGGLVLYSTFPAPLDLYDGLVLDETTITRDSSGRLHVISSGSSFDESAMWAALALTSPDTIHLSHLPSIPWSKITSPPSFSLVGHTHDDRYYTVTDINDKLANKANWDTAYGWGNHALAGYAALAGSTSQDFTTKTLNVADALNVTGLASFASGVGVQGAAITIYGKADQEYPYLDFRQGESGSALSRIISFSSGELSIFGKQVNGAVQPDGKIKLKNDTYVEKALYIGGDSGAKLVYVAASGETPAYLKLQNHDGGVMHFVTTGGQTMYSTGVPAAIEELQTEVMVIFNTSEEKADIIIGDRVKNRFMVIVPEATNGMIYINMIFNNVVPFGFLAEYEIYLYIESENVTNTLLTTECTLEPSETYSSGLIVGTLQSTDITGKGLHKLTYMRDIAAADTRMGLYVKHEYFEKV